ncbi:phosphomannomutase [Candidatus Nitrosopelagicus brevis]|uniref:Phosphomannomutase n=1 Tax=Candidatus Nitrosopelagicus brevis TaxID=1410606 RepID=A0A0A7V8H2_9ARCH|nr:phosphomannomutase [Candidatus Nitrosopelagicus brevis]AJA92965.1 phosphoglucomutase/phosphomannomutase, alpha/beta/alpha domain I [Candidatus Nitrosopelagicus brevis]PTL87561.1 phosphomannomutase [Candidatus Nitrosopelagicus brevis]
MKISISGIRGVYGKDFFPEDVIKFCNGFSKLIKTGKCAIGMDTRETGEMIQKLVSATMLERGIDVYNLGIIPTPVVFRKAKEIGAGIVITSSHNPLEWNGLKFIIDGRGITLNELEIVKNEKNLDKNEIGKEIISESNYISDAVKIIGKLNKTQQVTVDIGGGAAKTIAPKLLQEIGCQVETINDELDGCSRGPDPTSNELTELVSKTKDLGFAFDLDSDRVILVMNGEKKSSDITLGLGVVKAIKLGIKKFVLSIDSSLAVEKYIIQHGGKVSRSKVGEANVIQMMIENDAEAGGEGSSGGFILKDFNMCRDGLLTSGLIASMIDDESIQKDIEFFESFSQIRDKVSIESSLHDKIITEIVKKIEGKYKISQLDGIKISIDDNTWSLIRKSNTEDIIRISTESNDRELLVKIQKEMIKMVENCYEEIK